MKFANDKEKRAYFRQLGSTGGKTTVARHGREHMKRIGRKGFEATTEKHFRSEAAHKRFLATLGLYNYAASTGLNVKRDIHGNPIWPTEPPTHPAHDDFVEF